MRMASCRHEALHKSSHQVLSQLHILQPDKAGLVSATNMPDIQFARQMLLVHTHLTLIQPSAACSPHPYCYASCTAVSMAGSAHIIH